MYSTVYDNDLEQERREHAMRKKLAKLLSDGAEDWYHNLKSSSCSNLVMGTLFACVLSANSSLMLPVLMMMWGAVQFFTAFRPSCCRTVGLIAFGLCLVGGFVAPGAGVLATPFFELPLCLNTTSAAQGRSALYGLHAIGRPGASCAELGASKQAEPLQISISKGDLDAARHYRPVLFMPVNSHASLILTVLDAKGSPLYQSTRVDLGPDDHFEALIGAPASAVALPSAVATPGGAAANTNAAATAASSSSVSGAFDASTRRLDASTEGRRLRGFGGIGRMGGFSRGTGSFLSPRAGMSQGPRIGTSVVRGTPVAVGRPGASYVHNAPFTGGGYRPTMGYHPSLGFDIATGMMIGHMLREPHHRRPQNVLHGPHHGAATGQTPLGLPPPEGGTSVGGSVRDGAYYFASAALQPGSRIPIKELSEGGGGGGGGGGGSKEKAPAKTRALNSTYDRYALIDELAVPAAPDFPLRLVISAATFAPASSSAASGEPSASQHPPPIYLGLQAAGPPRLRSTVQRAAASQLLQFTACFVLLALSAAAMAGLGARRRELEQADLNDDLSENEVELGVIPRASQPLRGEGARAGGENGGGGAPPSMPVGRPVGVATPVGISTVPVASARVVAAAGGVACGSGGGASSAVHQAISADGEILTVGSRVQTQWTTAYGGDDSWWAGAILTLHNDSPPTATIIYDDGEEWRGKLSEVYALRGEEEEDHGGVTERPTPADPSQAPDRSR